MKLRTITKRAVVAGASTALAAGALVAASAPANAATVSNVYTCSYTPMAVTFDTTLTVSGELPVPQYWAGAAVPEGLLNVTATASDIPAAMIQFAGVTGAHSDDFEFDLSGAAVPVALDGEVDAETNTWNAEGANAGFVTPDPGTASALLPQAFTLVAESAETEYPLDCVLAEGEEAQTLASIDLLRQSSETIAGNKTVKKGKAAVVKVTVNSTSMNQPVTSGKVVAKKGKKTVATGKVKNGTAKLNFGKKLKVGKHKFKVSFAGIPSVDGSSTKVTVTVKKK